MKMADALQLIFRLLKMSVLGLFLVLTVMPVQAVDMSNWSDKTICRLVATQVNNAAFLEEASSRGLNCQSGQSNSPNQHASQTVKILPKPQGITIYAVQFSKADRHRLTSEPINKTAFDFNLAQLAKLSQPITCRFRLRRVIYEHKVEGVIEHWNMANGQFLANQEGIQLIGNWRMKGLSGDPSYLKDEVNLRLDDQGHLIGKMAYFPLMVDNGEAARQPIYITVKPHKRSKPLDMAKPVRAEYWIDVEDWAGGVLNLTRCHIQEETQ